MTFENSSIVTIYLNGALITIATKSRKWAGIGSVWLGLYRGPTNSSGFLAEVKIQNIVSDPATTTDLYDSSCVPCTSTEQRLPLT